jgi:hypothetical protein
MDARLLDAPLAAQPQEGRLLVVDDAWPGRREECARASSAP